MLRGESIHKVFKIRGGEPRRVLANCSLALSPGEITGIVGLNGVGKSTLMRILAGVLQPDAGTLTIDGLDRTAQPLERRRRVVIVQSESRGFYWRLSCRDNLRFFAVLQRPGTRRAALDAAVDEALATLDLTGHADQRFMTLSSGYMQRMTLARGLLHGGRYILLDEPSRELDARARMQFLDQVHKRSAEDGVGIAWITHRPEELEGRAGRYLVLGSGGTVQAVDSAAAAAAILAPEEG